MVWFFIKRIIKLKFFKCDVYVYMEDFVIDRKLNGINNDMI